MKAEYIEDIGMYRAFLSRGIYIIDGDTVEVESYNQEVMFRNAEIRKVCVNEVTERYEHSDGRIMSIDEHNDEWKKLKSKMVDDEWASLDDEFDYRKFIDEWSAIKRTVVTESEPLPIEAIKTTLETGNPFIYPIFGTDNQFGLFIYNRKDATLDIVNKCFGSLGMSFSHGIGREKTKNEKVWGNPEHSHLRFVVAFGRYIFSNKWESVCERRGTLDQCRNWYEEDKEELERTIKVGYHAHFNRDVQYPAEDLLLEMRVILSSLIAIDVKKSSKAQKSVLFGMIRNVIGNLETAITKENDDEGKD